MILHLSPSSLDPFLSESQRPASKRRKRKGSTSGPGNNAPPAPSKKRSPGPNFSLASQVSDSNSSVSRANRLEQALIPLSIQDVMVVGEPSLMGGDFGEEDERVITRLENTQYDATNSLDPHSHDTPGGPPPHPHQFHSEPTPGNSWPPDRGPGPPQGGPGSQVIVHHSKQIVLEETYERQGNVGRWVTCNGDYREFKVGRVAQQRVYRGRRTPVNSNKTRRVPR